MIRLCANDIERIVDEAEAALIKADRGLYQRDGLIVFEGTPEAIVADRSTLTGEHLAAYVSA